MNLSDTFITSFTESLMTYALGRRVEYHDMLAVRAIALEAAHNGNRMSSFIFGIVNSAAFQMKKSENTEPTTVVGESGDVLRSLSKKKMYGSPNSNPSPELGADKENHTSWERYYQVSDCSSSLRNDWYSGI